MESARNRRTACKGHLGEARVQPVTRRPTSERKRLIKNPKYGQTFSDYMVTARHTATQGWHDLTLGPAEPFAMSPASSVLHYGQAIYEGLKAYRHADGSVAIFRADYNAERFARSATRLAMPPLPRAAFVDSLQTLLGADHMWVPDEADGTLYLRPFMFASEPALGVRAAREYRFMVIASPAGNYFDKGLQPLRVWVTRDFVRASPGGTGAAKFAGNYASGMVAQAHAAEHGCDQVVWLDAAERRYVQELGMMNLFVVLSDDTVLTPPLGDTVLAGCTRDTIITHARERGLCVQERPIAIDEWRAWSRSGRVRESFACGTAATIAPIGQVQETDNEFVIGDGQPGALTIALRQQLLDLQFGRIEDHHGWRCTVTPA